MRFVVLGHKGMLGARCVDYLCKQGHQVDTLPVRYTPDDPKLFLDALWRVTREASDSLNVVINAIGAIPQKGCSDDYMMQINGVLPHLLARVVCSPYTVLVHPSTDCVFLGSRPGGAYTADDPPDAESAYGKSKIIGDAIGRQPNVVVLRTSIIDVSGGLLGWFLSRPRDSKIEGYTQHLWNGLTALEWIKVVIELLESGARSGIFQASCDDRVSKCELLRTAARIFGRGDISVAPYLGGLMNRTLRAGAAKGSDTTAVALHRRSIDEQLEELRINSKD